MVENFGYEVVGIIPTAEKAVKVAMQEQVDIVLMDIMLKGPMSGAEAAIELRAKMPEIIIIFLTAYSDEEMIEYAANAKASGYLLKPYREGEILATLKLATTSKKTSPHLHVTSTQKHSRVELCDNYRFDLDSSKLFLHGAEIALSQNTQKLLHLLCQKRNTFVASEELIEAIWGKEGSHEALRSLIYRLKNATTPNLIENYSKIGYRVCIQ